MNVTKVGSRECLIFGAGQMPKNEVTQVVKEFSVLSDRQVWSWLRLEEDRVPASVLTQIQTDAKSADLITYDVKLKDFPEWSAYGWEATSLTEVDEDDLVTLWLLDEDPTAAEISFAKSALAAGRPVLVMNDGLWEVDRIDDSGMYERMAEEPGPIDTPLIAEVQVPSSLPAEDNDYYSMDKETLKALVDERNVKADKRSVDSMITALIEDEVMRANVLPFPTAPAEEAAPNDHDPLTDEEQQRWAELERNRPADGAPDELPEAPEDAIDARHVTGEQIAANGEAVMARKQQEAITDLLEQAVTLLDQMAHHQSQGTLLTTQLATVMLELKKELSGEQPD